VIYSFLYVLTISIGLIFIQKIDVSISPVFSLMITATIASIYFNLINFRNIKSMYVDCFKNKKIWFLIMLLVLAMWFYTIAAPGLIGASLSTFLYAAWLGTLGLLSQSFNNWENNKSKFYCSLCILLLIFANIYIELRDSFSTKAIYGILLGFIGGTSAFIYFKVSQALAKNTKLTATQILAVRFYLAIFILFMVLPKQSFSQYFTVNNLLSLILLAFLALIIPLYFSQKALDKITSEQHAIICSLCPIATGVLQLIVFNDLKMEQMVIYFLYSIVITSPYFVGKYYRKAIVST